MCGLARPVGARHSDQIAHRLRRLAQQRKHACDRRGELVGALNITMPMGHESSEDAIARVLPLLRETAQAMRNLI